MNERSESSDKFRLKEEVAYQEVEDEFILVQPRNQELHRTNETGKQILSSLEQKQSVSDLVEQLCASFNVSEDQAREDVVSFLDLLQEKDLIEPIT